MTSIRPLLAGTENIVVAVGEEVIDCNRMYRRDVVTRNGEEIGYINNTKGESGVLCSVSQCGPMSVVGASVEWIAMMSEMLSAYDQEPPCFERAIS